MNNFEDRLQQFIQMENLTPAKLADTMGVQRGGLSHLLAGRNKPSFDFITRLLELYPDLNCDWLLLGKGKPFKDATSVAVEAPKKETPSLFDINTNDDDLPLSESDFLEVNVNSEENKILSSDNKEITSPAIHSQPRENRVSGHSSIIRITIFYSDGTFEER